MEKERKEMITEIKMYLAERVEILEKIDDKLRNFIFNTIEELIRKYKHKLGVCDFYQIYDYLDNLNLIDSIMNLLIKVIGLENELCNTSNHK